MKIKFNEEYNTLSGYVIIVFTACIIISMFLDNISNIFSGVGNILRVMSPIIWGIVIAYLLNPLLNLSEKLLKRSVFKSLDFSVDIAKLSNAEKFQFKKKTKLLRAVAVSITVVITIIILVIIVSLLLPELINSMSGFFNDFPSYVKNLYTQVNLFIEDNPTINSLFGKELEEQITTLQTELLKLFPDLKSQFDNIMDMVGKGISGLAGGIKNFLLGFIISIYLLFSKEEFIAQIRKGMFAIFPNEFTKKILTIMAKTNLIFLDFLVGKAVDSLIIGVLCFISLSILNMPYTVLISIVVGITNMIPFFGPFIGAIPSAVLVLLAEPTKTIVFIVFIIILQQIDGNIIGPKILGNKMGLSTFWIMFAILIFGGLFGFVGMFIGVPVFTLIYISINAFVEDRLKNKNMPMDKRYYRDMSITEKECIFPNKVDFSDEDIDESKLSVKKDYVAIVKEKALLVLKKLKSINIEDIFKGKR